MVPLVALVLRWVFSLGTFVIVALAMLDAWGAGQPLLALVAFVATPITFFVYPWISGIPGLVVVQVVCLVAFAGSGIVGGRR